LKLKFIGYGFGMVSEERFAGINSRRCGKYFRGLEGLLERN
jgi:hypothetical protein